MKKYLSIMLALLFFTLFWHIFSLQIERPILPGPATAAEALVRLASAGRLHSHLLASLSRVLLALFLCGIPAIALGLAAGRCRRVDYFVSPVVYLLHPLPKPAFLPIIILFLGLGEASKIFLVAFIIFSQILVTMRDAAKQVPPELLESVRSLGAGKAGLFLHVVVPSVLPAFFTALRISLGTAVAVLFLAETFASQSGLGFLIMDAWSRLNYAEMYAGIMTLSLLGLFLFFLTDLLEYLFCPWLRG